MSKSNGIYITREEIKSEAFKALTKTEIHIYFEFLLRRKIGKLEGKPGKGRKAPILNNGEIVFTFNEALKMGIPKKTFLKAIDKLVNVGLLDISKSGSGGVKGDCSLYGFSDRWRYYGTDRFVKKPRNKDTRGDRGWAIYHKRKKGESGIAD